MAKKKTPTFRTPRGIAHFPRLNDPDTKFHKHGVYKADILLTDEQAQPLIKQVQEWALDKMGEELPVSDTIIKKKGKYRPNEDNNVFQPDFDPDTGEMTGNWVFKLRVKNYTYTDKKTKEEKLWDRRPKVFSASGKPAMKAKIGGGSEYAVVYEVYFGKVSTGELYMALQPVAIQLYKLVEWSAGGASAADYGIEADEGWEPEDDFSDDMADDDADDDADDGMEDGEDDF